MFLPYLLGTLAGDSPSILLIDLGTKWDSHSRQLRMILVIEMWFSQEIE
jgi:hypothetical protein